MRLLRPMGRTTSKVPPMPLVQRPKFLCFLDEKKVLFSYLTCIFESTECESLVPTGKPTGEELVTLVVPCRQRVRLRGGTERRIS